LGDNKMLTVNKIMDLAKAELINIEKEELFLVSDLFKGYMWDKISRSDRLLSGNLFLNILNK